MASAQCSPSAARILEAVEVDHDHGDQRHQEQQRAGQRDPPEVRAQQRSRTDQR
ncbi:hypothetical protein ACFWN2_05350 [Lentzea sp. NPDC058436]|uniref:hypothetical protein n=1 Tax=Lentzea sp. NPDC058436 TaxID=3346499 RepID=UPI00364CFCE4